MTADRDEPPGLGPPEDAGVDRLLVHDWTVSSGAVHHPIDDTWTAAVFVKVQGRWNRTDMLADLDMMLPVEAAADIAEGLVEASVRSFADIEAHLNVKGDNHG